MCLEVRVRHRCQHLGRIRGFESCRWYDLMEELIESGMNENHPIVQGKLAQCRLNSSPQYVESDDLCVACLEREQERSDRHRRRAEDLQQHDKRSRESIEALFKSLLIDNPKKKVKFSIGPRSSDSSSAEPSVGSPSRPTPWARRRASSFNGGPEDPPPPGARFNSPMDDLTLQDMEEFEEHFQIQAPQSVNWVFHCEGEEAILCENFTRFLNSRSAMTNRPGVSAVNFSDMYPPDVVETHLTRHLPSDKQWKAAALSLFRYASCAQGSVHLLLPRDEMNSDWELWALWALTSSGRVGKITRYNADDFSVARVLWRIDDPVMGELPDFVVPPSERPLLSVKEEEEEVVVEGEGEGEVAATEPCPPPGPVFTLFLQALRERRGR